MSNIYFLCSALALAGLLFIAANALGYVYLQSEDLDEAESWYKKAMEFRPAHSQSVSIGQGPK